jgi:hypothetical protein
MYEMDGIEQKKSSKASINWEEKDMGKLGKH